MWLNNLIENSNVSFRKFKSIKAMMSDTRKSYDVVIFVIKKRVKGLNMCFLQWSIFVVNVNKTITAQATVFYQVNTAKTC